MLITQLFTGKIPAQREITDISKCELSSYTKYLNEIQLIWGMFLLPELGSSKANEEICLFSSVQCVGHRSYYSITRK